MLGFTAFGIIGWIMLVSSGKSAVQYTGVFFATAGIFPCVPIGVAWNGNNIGGTLKRGVGIAMHVGFGNLGGTIAAFIYLPKDSPRYSRYSCCSVFLMVIWLTVFQIYIGPFCAYRNDCNVIFVITFHDSLLEKRESSS